MAATSLELMDRFDGVGGWDELALASGNVFATREWLETWWRTFGGKRQLALAAAHDAGGALSALVPLYLASERPRVVRFVGHGVGGRVGPVALARGGAGGAADVGAEATATALAALRWSFLLAEELPAEARLGAALGGRTVAWSPSPTLELRGRDWDELCAGFSRNFRSQLGRKERRLDRLYGLRYRLVEDAAELPAALDRLFALHREHFPVSRFGAAERFHRAVAPLLHARGWLRLWFLELGGRPVAAWYGFRFGRVDAYYQAGREQALEHESPGLVLLAHTLRRAAEDGIEEYRFGPGGGGYKYRFHVDDPGVETVVLARGRLGGAALAGLTAARRLARWRR